MIRLLRPNVSLKNLERNQAVKRKIQEIEAWLQQGRPEPKPVFQKFWNRDDVRGALIAQQGLVCAWCQTRLKLKSQETTVDHYRPVDYRKPNPETNLPGDPHKGYPWLAYSWSNLLMSCSECNSFKGSRFPLLDETQRVEDSKRNQPTQEAPLFLDPTDAGVEHALTLELVGTYPYHWVRASPHHPSSDAAKKTIEYLNLDGQYRPDLSRDRFGVIRTVLRALEKNNCGEMITEACRYRDHAWSARRVLMVLSPERIPSAEDDLFFLLEGLSLQLADIEGQMAFFESKRENFSKEGYGTVLRRIRWAYAVLAFDHSLKAAVVKYIEAYLSDESLKMIKGYLEKLKT